MTVVSVCFSRDSFSDKGNLFVDPLSIGSFRFGKTVMSGMGPVYGSLFGVGWGGVSSFIVTRVRGWVTTPDPSSLWIRG